MWQRDSLARPGRHLEPPALLTCCLLQDLCPDTSRDVCHARRQGIHERARTRYSRQAIVFQSRFSVPSDSNDHLGGRERWLYIDDLRTAGQRVATDGAPGLEELRPRAF